jgi:ABC-type glutathione transport system ATPase component
LREAGQSLLDVAQRDVNVRGQEARLRVTAQIVQKATVESAEFLFVHANEFSGGDKQRHDFSPSL